MSDSTEDTGLSQQERDAKNKALVARLKQAEGLEGITFLSGNESNLNTGDLALLERFKDTAKKMGIHPPPKLFFYRSDAHDDSTNALSGILDGTYMVGLSQSIKRAMQVEAGDEFYNSALERMVALAAHEEGHIRRKDNDDRRGSRLESIQIELAADKEGVRATCNPQAMEEQLKLAYLADAREAGTTVEKLVVKEEQTGSDHPLLPTRIAHLEYMKAHPPRGCKTK